MNTVKKFSEYVQMQIQEYLPEQYQEADCFMKEILRNNGGYGTSMEFHVPGENVVCSIHMDPYYAEFKQGRPFGEIMEKIAIQIQDTYEIEKLMKENHIEDFQSMKPYLRISLINTGRNRERLLCMPHMEMEDLSMVCRVDIPGLEGHGTMEVTNDVLQAWGIRKETLFDTALKNMQESGDYVMQTGSSKIHELFADAPAPENLLNAPADTALDLGELFYILTNKENVRGASAMLCPWVMKKVSDLFPEGFYILPSSIHETLIISQNGENSVKELREIVRNANRTAVKKEEILSDNIYQYDRETERVCQVSKPIEKKREAER
ncbi:MAG: hypothetical protein HFH10_12710 [Dorea sp.]|nr:hypothetical protein [Dorea sp.]